MRKNIYIPDDKIDVFKEAKKVFGGKSISHIIIELLENEVFRKKELLGFEKYFITDDWQNVKLIGKRLATYEGEYFSKPGENLYIFKDHFVQEGGNSDATRTPGWHVFSEGESPPENFTINAYQTKSGEFYIEVKHDFYEEIDDDDFMEEQNYSYLIHIKDLRDFFRDKMIGNLPLPDKFIEDFKNAVENAKQKFFRIIE